MADKLREYLIALGFKIDPATYKKFTSAIAATSKEVAGLGSVAASTATAIGLSVEHIAREYEGLFYLSQRTRASVNDLKSFSFGMKQIGIDAGQSEAAIDSFTRAMRLNPGVKGFVGLGGGTGASPIEQLTNFVEHQKKLYGEAGYYVAAMNAELAGIPEATFLQIWNNLPKLKAAQEEMNRMRREAGLSTDELTDQSVRFTNAWDHLMGSIGIGKDRITDDLIRPTTLAVHVVDEIVQAFNKADKATAGWIGTLSGLAAAAGAGAGSIALLLGGLGKLGAGPGAGGFMRASFGAARFLPAAASAAWLIGLGDEAAETPEGKKFHASGDLVHDIYGWLRAVKPTLQRRFGITPEGEEGASEKPQGTIGEDAGSHDTGAFKDKKEKEAFIRSVAEQLRIDPDTAMRVARSEGFNNFVSSIPGEKSYGAFQLHVTPGGGGHAVGDEFQSLTGLDPSDPANEHESIRFALEWAKRHGWGDFHGAANTGIANWQGIAPRFDTALAPAAGDTNNVTINQNTSISVASPDPASAGTAVANAQDRVNGDLVRNLKGGPR